jgi:hypothetical protein
VLISRAARAPAGLGSPRRRKAAGAPFCRSKTGRVRGVSRPAPKGQGAPSRSTIIANPPSGRATARANTHCFRTHGQARPALDTRTPVDRANSDGRPAFPKDVRRLPSLSRVDSEQAESHRHRGDRRGACLAALSAIAESVENASSCPRPPSAASADAASTASSIVRFSSSSRSRSSQRTVNRTDVRGPSVRPAR